MCTGVSTVYALSLLQRHVRKSNAMGCCRGHAVELIDVRIRNKTPKACSRVRLKIPKLRGYDRCHASERTTPYRVTMTGVVYLPRAFFHYAGGARAVPAILVTGPTRRVVFRCLEAAPEVGTAV